MKIGLALSGGGARGIAHLGVLKAFDELGIQVTHISGTSAGAMVGALYAYGHTPDEIFDIILKTNFFKLIRPAISKTGLLKIDTLEQVYHKYLPVEHFESLDKKLTIAVTNITSGKTVYFAEGPLIRPLMASSCIPVVFDPVEISDDLYVDGGILNNLPTEPLIGVCEKIIGIHSNPVQDNFKVSGMKAVLERSFLLSINANAYQRKGHCDVFIEPHELSRFGVFDVGSAKEIFRIGYEYTMSESKKELLAALGMDPVKSS